MWLIHNSLYASTLKMHAEYFVLWPLSYVVGRPRRNLANTPEPRPKRILSRNTVGFDRVLLQKQRIP